MMHLRQLASLLAFVALAMSVEAQSLGGPPPGFNWIQNPANGHFYAMTANSSWAAAAALADSLGAETEMVTIRSQAEMDWLVTTFALGSLPFNSGVWIGFNDEAVEGVWEWRSGEPVVYTNWAPGEPNNTGNEDYANIVVSGATGPWNDVDDLFDVWPALLEWIPGSGLHLAQVGTCPGPISLTVQGATPSGKAAIACGAAGIFARATPPCAGVFLGVTPRAQTAILDADSSGTATLSVNAGAGLCGRSVQAVDVTTCLATNVIVL